MKSFARHLALGLAVAGAALLLRAWPANPPAGARRAPPAAESVYAPASSALVAAPARVHLNRASTEELEALPGIGPKLAERIVAYRRAHGPFRLAEELRLVKGIGPKKWAAVRPFVAP